MVEVPDDCGGNYCIDSTEVTNSDYEAFVEAGVSPDEQESFCIWNDSFVPDVFVRNTSPVVGVDWCDALAYCAWAGKRLCGALGGGHSPFDAYADASTSQWHRACSGGGSHVYPYGDEWEPRCNTYGSGTGAVATVKSHSDCVGGYPELFDMSGNVWEWEDSCRGYGGAADRCRVRGGSAYSGDGKLEYRCDYDPWGGIATRTDLDGQRNHQWPNVGFRCCAP